MEFVNTKMVMFIKENGKMDCKMELEFTYSAMGTGINFISLSNKIKSLIINRYEGDFVKGVFSG